MFDAHLVDATKNSECRDPAGGVWLLDGAGQS